MTVLSGELVGVRVVMTLEPIFPGETERVSYPTIMWVSREHAERDGYKIIAEADEVAA